MQEFLLFLLYKNVVSAILNHFSDQYVQEKGSFYDTFRGRVTLNTLGRSGRSGRWQVRNILLSRKFSDKNLVVSYLFRTFATDNI